MKIFESSYSKKISSETNYTTKETTLQSTPTTTPTANLKISSTTKPRSTQIFTETTAYHFNESRNASELSEHLSGLLTIPVLMQAVQDERKSAIKTACLKYYPESQTCKDDKKNFIHEHSLVSRNYKVYYSSMHSILLHLVY